MKNDIEGERLCRWQNIGVGGKAISRERIGTGVGMPSRRKRFLSGSQYIVTWALGHLVELAEPEAYGEQYKTWSMDTLPMLPEKMELKVIPETSKQYSIVKSYYIILKWDHWSLRQMRAGRESL